MGGSPAEAPFGLGVRRPSLLGHQVEAVASAHGSACGLRDPLRSRGMEFFGIEGEPFAHGGRLVVDDVVYARLDGAEAGYHGRRGVVHVDERKDPGTVGHDRELARSHHARVLPPGA